MELGISSKYFYYLDLNLVIQEQNIDPVNVGEFTAYWLVKIQKVPKSITNVKIFARFKNENNPALSDYDTRNVNFIGKLNREKNGARMEYVIHELKQFKLVWDRDIFERDRKDKEGKNREIILNVIVNKVTGYGYDSTKHKCLRRQRNYRLLSNALQNGDVKIFYQPNERNVKFVNKENNNSNNKNTNKKRIINIDDESDDNQPPAKKRRRSSNNNSSSLDADETNDNKSDEGKKYLKFSSELLMAESKYFAIRLKSDFVDKNEIEFDGDLVQLKCLLEYVATGVINPSIDPIFMLNVAGLYDMDTLKESLVRNIINNVNHNNFVYVMNRFSLHKMTSGYEEIIKYGVKHYKKLSNTGKWAQLDHDVRQRLKKEKKIK